MSGDPRTPIYPTNVVYRPEFDGVIRRLEAVENDGKTVAVAAADISYMKRTIRAMKKDLDDLKDESSREKGGQEWRATAIAITGAMVGVAGIIVAILALTTGGP